MSALRILVVHNRYQLPGGEDAVVDAEVELLRRHGHDVATYVRDNRDLGRMSALEAFAQTMWSRRTVSDIAGLSGGFRPDVIHCHNTFALVSPSLYWAARQHGIPVVQTLHNFRLLCAQAMFLRQRRVCEDCLGHIPWRAVPRKCYRNSGLQSAALVTMLTLHRAIRTYRGQVTRYIALTEFCRRKFIAGGLPASRIDVKPNFVDVARPDTATRSGGLFVGRLAPEKGIDTLLQALAELPTVTIDVIGTGPEQHKVVAHPQLRLLGWRSPGEIYERMRRASYLVMPSIWYESFPRTLVEAFANGLPVIASGLGSLRELVGHGVTGLTFTANSPPDLARHLAWAEAFPAKMRAMGDNARAQYEGRFSPDENYRRLVAIYQRALSEQRPQAAA